MGELSSGSRPFSFSGSIEVKSVDETVCADAGALLMRELMERSGLVAWLEENLLDTRRPSSVAHSVGNLLRTFLLLILQAWPTASLVMGRIGAFSVRNSALSGRWGRTSRK